MATVSDNVIGLSRASARFAARLVHAGALSALERLASKQLAHSGEAAKQGAGADAGDSTSRTEQVVMDCCAAFRSSVPRVSHRD